jgi:hypothetical protein
MGLPEPLHTVGVKDRFNPDERHIHCQALREEEAVEGVFVVERKCDVRALRHVLFEAFRYRIEVIGHMMNEALSTPSPWARLPHRY